jgi:hypothetical protein
MIAWRSIPRPTACETECASGEVVHLRGCALIADEVEVDGDVVAVYADGQRVRPAVVRSPSRIVADALAPRPCDGRAPRSRVNSFKRTIRSPTSRGLDARSVSTSWTSLHRC